MTDLARKLLHEAMELSEAERADLAEGLLESLPADDLHPDSADEIEHRARRAWKDPDGGEPWEAVERRLRARVER